jgi:hypothetical protein
MFHVKHLRKALIHKDLCVKQNKPTADILDYIGGGSSMAFIHRNMSDGGFESLLLRYMFHVKHSSNELIHSKLRCGKIILAE